MHKPRIPADEVERLRTLRALSILDTLPEERFDRYTRLARRLFDVPIALVSLVDERRQWFKSRQGLDAQETPRDISFCGHAIHSDEVLHVSNALEDERFADNPLVAGDPSIRFYAGFPLCMPGGQRLGTLCVIDREPRRLDDEELELLRDLGCMVVDEMSALAMATVDELTGLSNRRGFVDIAGKVLAASERGGQQCCLVYIDLDGFKVINDCHGHATGDQALKDFSGILLNAFRHSDVIGRLGGDEFAVLASGSDAAALMDGALARLSDAVDAFNRGAGRLYDLRYSVGCEQYSPDVHAGVEEFLASADLHMYADKRGTREELAEAAAERG